MDWKELKHEINMSMVDFKRTHGLECNVLILGKKEYEALQSDEVKKEFFETNMYGLKQKFGDSSGDIEQIWSMRVCRINIDSIIKAGHVV